MTRDVIRALVLAGNAGYGRRLKMSTEVSDGDAPRPVWILACVALTLKRRVFIDVQASEQKVEAVGFHYSRKRPVPGSCLCETDFLRHALSGDTLWPGSAMTGPSLPPESTQLNVSITRRSGRFIT